MKGIIWAVPDSSSSGHFVMLPELDQVADDTALPIQQQLRTHQTAVPNPHVEQEEFCQVLAYGELEHRTWLVERCGAAAVRAWLCKRRGGGLSAKRLSEWFEAGTIRRWQREKPGAAIWENR